MRRAADRFRFTAVPMALLVAATTPLFAADGPPAAPVRPVTDTYFGTEVVDPYRDLETLADPAVQAWMKAQSDHTRALLDTLPGRRALQERIHALSNADTRRGGFVRRGQRYFYSVSEPGAEQPKLYYRDGLGGAEHLLIDPATLARGTGAHFAVDYYAPSWDGKLLAYGLSQGGSEASVLRVLDVATGRDLAEKIERAHDSTVSWRADNRSFFYFKFDTPRPGTPPSETEFNAKTFLHVVGRRPDGEADPAVFGRGVSKAVAVPEGQVTYVVGAPQSNWAVAAANHNADDNPSTWFAAPMARATGPAAPWKKIAEVDDGVRSVALRGDTLYFLSGREASRFRILATSLRRPDVKHAKVVVPEGRGVITDFALARDGLYYRERTGATTALRKVGFDGGVVTDVPLPFEGTLTGPVTDPAEPGALFGLQSPSRPPQFAAYDPASGRSTDTGLVPPSKVDVSSIESTETMVTSHDGTRVPLTLVHRKGLLLDGSHPTILEGYGAYGLTLESRFSPSELAWIERGGVFATAHVRGGGEYGEDWHRGGMMQTKLNTVFDFIACGQYLVDAGFTIPKRLAAEGGSAGGITVGRAMTLRPDLFGVILDHVGMSDTLRYETEPNGPPNTVEFGSIKTEAGFHGLYAMSPYEHIAPGTAYPAVMYLTGANDPRVAPWHMLKMAARTQAATGSGRPVLLRIDDDAGHGMGSNRSQREAQLADTLSFALWQMGDPAFQPIPFKVTLMEHRSLGRSGLKVPVLSLGTGTFGGGGNAFFERWGRTEGEEAARIVDLCLEHGLNFFDTADIYSAGNSERVLGEALKGKRDRVLISSKASFKAGAGPNDTGSSRFHLVRACEASLKRLQTDHIDVYFMHGFDAMTPVDETLRALDDLVTSGKIGYIGASNFSGWHLMKSLATSERLGLGRYVAYQGYYSLIGRDYEWELMPLMLDQGVGTMVWSPLGWGRLTGKIRRGQEMQSGRIASGGAVGGPPVDDETLFDVVDALDAIATAREKTVAQVALNWLLARPTVANIVVGARDETQLLQNLGALGWSLTADEMATLDAVSRQTPVYPYWHQKDYDRNPKPTTW